MDWAHCKYTRDLRILISRYPWIFEAFHTFLQIHLLAHIHVSCIHLTWVDDFIFVVLRYGHFYMFISYLQYANIPWGHPSICVSVFVGLSTMGSWSYILTIFTRCLLNSIGVLLIEHLDLHYFIGWTLQKERISTCCNFLMFSTSKFVPACLLWARRHSRLFSRHQILWFRIGVTLIWESCSKACCKLWTISDLGHGRKKSENQRKGNHPIERMDDWWLDVLLFATLTLACRFAVEALIDNMQKRERWGGCKLIDKVYRVCKWI